MTRTPGRYPAQVIVANQVTDITTIVSSISTILADPDTLIFNRQDQLNQPVEVNIKEMFENVLTQTSNSPFTKTKVGLEASAKVTVAAEKFQTFIRAFNSVLIPETAKAVTGITRTGTVATATTNAPHNYYLGDTVTIAGATQTDYNGDFQVTSTPSTTTFTYTVSGSPVTPATGTITVLSEQHGAVAMSDDAGYNFGSPELPYKTVIIRPFAGANVITNPETWVIFPFAGSETDGQFKYGLSEQYGYSIMFTAFPDPLTGQNRVLKGNTALLV